MRVNTLRRYLAVLRPIHYVLLAVLAIATYTVTYHRQVEAAYCDPGDTQRVMGRRCWYGYFDNRLDAAGDNVLPVISGGNAIPTSVNTADELYNLIRNAYLSGNAQRRTGAAFIVNTMMGRAGGRANRTITNAEWTALLASLRALDAAGRISWTGNVSDSINSYWQGINPGGTLNDDAYYREFKNEPGIRIRDYNGNVIYEILRRCANPVGTSRALPPPQDYRLDPAVISVSPTAIEEGATVNIRTRVTNTGTVPSDSSRWEITRITVAPGSVVPHLSDPAIVVASGDPCGSYYRGPGAPCVNHASGSQAFPVGATDINATHIAEDVPAGTKLCFALSIRPYSGTDSSWAHSRPRCTVVGKEPKMHVLGGDLYVTGDIETSTTVKVSGGNRTFGSWVEYGLFAGASSMGIGSAAAFAGNGAEPGTTLADWNKLTFANVDASGTSAMGQFGSVTGLPSMISQFAGLTSSGAPTSNLGTLSSGTYHTNDLTVNASDIAQQDGRGKTIIIVASGTVTIDGDIRYRGPGNSDVFTSVTQLPQVIIIAHTIRIAGNVENIDAWLLTRSSDASDSISTCSDVTPATQLTIATCSRRLSLNGIIETSRLHLLRTAGADSGADSGTPAEILNARADAYMWTSQYTGANGKAQTVYMSELPPRF